MLLIVALMVASPIANADPPRSTGACKWVRGRFNVWNGSSVRRIWVIGTHRMIALRDGDDNIPDEVRKYIYSGPYPPKADGLFGDFRVCALEPSRAGHMQHIRLIETKHLIFQGKAFRPQR